MHLKNFLIVAIASALIWLSGGQGAYAQLELEGANVQLRSPTLVSNDLINQLLDLESLLDEDLQSAQAKCLDLRESQSGNSNPDVARLLDDLQTSIDQGLSGSKPLLTDLHFVGDRCDPRIALLSAMAKTRIAQRNSDYRTATHFFDLMKVRIQGCNHPRLRSVANARLGMQLWRLSNRPEVVGKMVQELEASKVEYPTVDLEIAIRLLTCTAECSGDFEKMGGQLESILEFAEAEGRLRTACEILSRWGYCQRELGNRTGVATFRQKALQLGEALQDDRLTLSLKTACSTLSNRQLHFEESRDLLRPLLDDPMFENLTALEQHEVATVLMTAASKLNLSGLKARVRKFTLTSQDQGRAFRQLQEERQAASEMVQQELERLAELKVQQAKIESQIESLKLENTSLAVEQENLQSVLAQRSTQLLDAQRKGYLVLTVLMLVGAAALLGVALLIIRRKYRHQEGELDEQNRNVDDLNIKLARMRRMDSLGLMAGSIAHDFNNILVGVAGNAELIELSHETGCFSEDYALERVAAIKDSASRAQKLAKQMLNYAGKQYAAQKTVDLNRLISGYESVFNSFSKKNHQIELRLANEPVMSKVDETQFEQALFNLVTNAISASSPGSRIVITTSRTSVDHPPQTDPTLFGTRDSGGNFSCVSIQDFGTGIPEQELENIFEPYFSDAGHGRGLGLAVVYGIVDSHHGLVRCRSVYGKGTTFELLFPVANGAEEDSIDAYVPSKTPNLAETHAGKQVLVIDDELSVLDTCEQFLLQFGLVPRSVHVQGERGIDLILEALSEEAFDAILMDVVMPELIGTQILDVLRDREITTPVILMSGFSPERLDFYQKRKSVSSILPKPFGIAELVRAIQTAIPVDEGSISQPNDPASVDDAAHASGTQRLSKPPKFHSHPNRGAGEKTDR